MNQTLVAVLVGLLAGAAGAFTVKLLDAEPAVGAAGSMSPSASVEARLAGIEQALRDLQNPPGTLTTRSPAEGGGGRGGALTLDAAGVDALLARIDERVGKTVETKMEALSEKAGEDSGGRRGRRNRKRLALADAARELELSAQQEDELRRIFQENQNKIFKLLAEPDGDPEEVRREIMEAAESPGGAQKLMGKYMPKFISKIGDIMVLQTQRETAIRNAVGPEKAQQLEHGYSIKEDDILGLRGGMQMEVQGDVRGN